MFPGTLDTNSYSRTIEPISSSNWTQHGSTCYFYACYKIEPFEGPNTYLRTTRFTCVIVGELEEERRWLINIVSAAWSQRYNVC